MPIPCSAPGCFSQQGILNETGQKLSFHRFPKDESLKQKWLRNMRRGEWTPTKFSRLCSLHFEPICYREGSDKKILHSYAVPTIFPNQTTIAEKVPVKRRIIMKTENTASTSSLHECKENENPKKRKVVMEASSAIRVASSSASTSAEPLMSVCQVKSQVSNQFTTENIPGTSEEAALNDLKKQLARYKMLAERRGRKLKNIQRKHQRVTKRVANLESIIKDLQSKLEAEQLVMLKNNIPVDNKVLSRYIMKSQGRSLPKEYPIEIKQFALTLQFLSPKAYEHVRDSFDTVLPHPKTLSRWYKVVDCQPGFTTESLETIKLRCALSQKTLYASLSMDEMAIRKHVQWDGTKCHGYVDFGAAIDSQSDDTPLATEALVFMLTCVNEAWKIPVGYFLINGLSGNQKANLVTQCIRLLSETGIKVISLTFDGAPANASMATQLGCNLSYNNLATSFRVEEQEVAILYDPCHNIKLIRNSLGEKKIFFDKDDKEISWAYLEKLQDLQAFDGLHAANKLSVAHINYETQKMKVKLATQLLSNSVADALETCKNQNIEGFADSEPTIKFIRYFNDLFDILNSRNLASYGYKRPLRSDNISDVRKRLLEIDEYINGLKLSDGTLLLNSRKKTGFLGFKICIKSILFIYDKYLAVSDPAHFYFLPVYKMSQDHVEIFFGAIRSAGGFNNNPSAYAFKSAYKKLLVHAEFKISRNGNCLPLDDIRILHTCAPKYVDTINETSRKGKLLDESNLDCKEIEYFDHDYLFSPNLSDFSEMVVVYIGGYVVRKLRNIIFCEPCCKALENKTAENPISANLILTKNRGGLYMPSADVITICKYSEKLFRRYLHVLGVAEISKPKSILSMTLKVFRMCAEKNVFQELTAHSTENCVSNNHLHLLIKTIVDAYFKVRIHHECKKQSIPPKNIRNKYTKLILFGGQ